MDYAATLLSKLPGASKRDFGLGQLVETLKAYLPDDHIRQILKAYENERIDRTARVQAASWEQGQKNHAVGTGGEHDDFRGGSFADPAWIYGYDAPERFPLRGT